jgi:hypothetical protein
MHACPHILSNRMLRQRNRQEQSIIYLLILALRNKPNKYIHADNPACDNSLL